MEPEPAATPPVPTEPTIEDSKKRKRDDESVNPDIPDPKKTKTEETGDVLVGSGPDQPSSEPAGHDSSARKKKPVVVDGKKKVFQYGNYLGYYGYRLTADGRDPRIGCMKPEWFDGKEVLDIGCNSGVFTIQLACYFNVKKVEGRDIDKHLIDLAIRTRDSWYEEHFKLPEGQQKKNVKALVTFKQENFVDEKALKSSGPPKTEWERKEAPAAVVSGLPVVRKQTTYDTVTCMSVTKWIHLNFGDEGILAAFKRLQQLTRVGGYLIIEIQDWKSYRKKKDMTETTAAMFEQLKLRPHQFAGLLAERFYFKFICEITPEDSVSKGFTRPISVFQRV